MRKHCRDTRLDQLYRVFLNGKELKYVIEFDSGEGWADCYIPNERGKLEAVDPLSFQPWDGEVQTTRLQGTITYIIEKRR